MKFEIVPYVSVGPLTWGLQLDTVASIIGKADHSSRNRAGNTVEFREVFSQSCIYEKNTLSLIEVTFSQRKENMFFSGIDLIGSSNLDVVRQLHHLDKSAMTGFGSIVFPALGIALTGYLPNEEEINAVGAFAYGRWDRAMVGMEPLKTVYS